MHRARAIEPGDIIALADGDPYRVIATLPLSAGATKVPVLASRIALGRVAR